MARVSDAGVRDRRNKIIQYIGKNLFSQVSDLSALLGVSEVTIRRDLKYLAKKGKIDRTYGGAKTVSISEHGSAKTTAIHSKNTLEEECEKQLSADSSKIAQKIPEFAIHYFDIGDVIFLSAGPLSEGMAHLMLEAEDITVITNSIRIFDILKDNRHIHLLSTGGELYHSQYTLVGPLAETSLRDIRVDKFFFEPSGISQDMQLYCSSLADVSIQSAMIHAAREVIVMADRAKFNCVGIKQLGELNLASKILVTSDLSAQIIEKISQKEIEIVRL